MYKNTEATFYEQLQKKTNHFDLDINCSFNDTVPPHMLFKSAH